MPSLRSSLIRLAHQNPHLRPRLLPLLKEGAPKGKNLIPLDQMDEMLNDPAHGTRSFGVEYDGHGTPCERADEIVYALAYQVETSGLPVNSRLMDSILAWGKERGCGPQLARSYAMGTKDGKAAADL